MAAPVLQFKRGSLAALPGLQAGEPGWVTDSYDLFVGIDSNTSNNKVVGSARYWTREGTTSGSAVRMVEGTNNGQHYVSLGAPAALTSSEEYILPAAAVAGGYMKVDGSGNMSWSTEIDIDTPLSVLDIDGGTDIGADLADGDLLIVDDGGGGTNRKTAMSRVKSYVLGGGAGATFAAINVSGIGSIAFVKSSTGTFTGVVTAASFDGDLATSNLTGTVDNSQLTNSTISFGGISLALGAADATPAFNLQDATGYLTSNLVGTITNTQLAGSIADSKLNQITSANKVDVSAIDIDGATDIGADLVDADLLVVDDGAGGTNRKTAMSRVKDYVLGGGAGANFVNLQATGITTTVQLQTVDINVSAGATVTGALDVDGGANIASGLTVTGGLTANSAIVSDLTDGRVVLAGTSGELEDSGNLTFNGSTLAVTGAATVSTNLGVSGEATLASATISDLTDNRVLIAGTAGAVEDSGNLTFDGSDLGVTGDVTASGTVQAANVTATTAATLASAAVQDLTDGRVVLAGAGGELGDDSGLTYGDNDLRVTGGINATGIASATSFATGAEGSAIIVTSDTITGPSSITLDPAALNDNSGTVFILGDLQVKGTTTQVDSTTVSVADLAIEVAKGAANDAAANGGGFTVDSGDGDKTFHFEALGDNFGSSENLNLASGKVLKVANTEILSAAALASSVSVDVASINLDGATAIGADLVDADLFLVDDGAGGTNRKITATEIKDYMLGGGAGANFAAINVSGISTVTFADATTLKVGAGATVTGALDVDGGANIASGLVANSAKVSDLTSGRVVLAGTDGEIEDSGNLTFDGSTVGVTGGITVSGAVDANGGMDVTGDFVANSAKVSDLTSGRIVLAGTDGELEDNSALTFNGSTFAVTGAATVSTNLTVTQELSARDASLRNVVSSGVITATNLRNAAAGLLPLVGVSSASGHTGIVTGFKFNGTGVEAYKVEDGTATVTLSGVAATTFTSSNTIVATQGQTSFTVASGFQEGFVDVYHNGVRLITGTDYTQGVDGQTVTIASGATVGDELEFVAWKSLGDIVNIASLKTAGNLTVSGVATATGGFVGDLTGDVTGTVSSGSGLGAGTVPLTSLDIDGGSDIGADLVDADLLIVDDGAGGTNKKTAMSRVKSYVLGGGSGATFAAINVTGIATNTYLDSTTAKVGAGLTVGGAIDGNGGADISGGETVLSSATVSDLTNGRVVIAGSNGSLGDDSNFTWDGSTLGVGGAISGSGGASITGGETVMSSATVSDLTSGRVVLAGGSGALQDNGGLTYDGSTLAVTGAVTVSTNMTVTGDLVVEGSTTQINTTNTTIEDVLLELQKVDGGNLSADTNKDVGIVMNYYSGSAKKAAVFWDDSAGRFALASDASESSGVLGSITYAGLEVGSLYVNDCAGQSQVISCSGTTRSLENVTIDGGTF